MTAWYRHRYHTLASHRLVFAVMPRLPRFLHPVAAVHIDDHAYIVRSETKGTVGKVFPACSVAVPPALAPSDRSLGAVQEDGSACHYTKPVAVRRSSTST